MRAVVLAAGVGSRLGALTRRVPKCMIEVGGAPILEHDVRLLAAAGIAEIAVNLHHLPEVVTGHFGSGSDFGVRIAWSYEPELLGTAGTVASLRPWLTGGTFLVVYGDNVLKLDIARCIAAHRRSGALATVALFERDHVSASGVAELDITDRVVRFVEKPRPGETYSSLVNAGFLVLEPEALAHMPARGDFSHDVLPQLAAARSLHGHRLAVDEHPLWVDTPDDLVRTVALAGGAA